MKRLIRATLSLANRYFIANSDGIPYHAQPENGYTELQAISAVQRYAEEDAKLFGGQYTDYIHDYCILDSRFRDVTDEFYDAV